MPDSPSPDPIDLLEDNLRRQLETHRRLLGSIERTREAVRRADIERVAELCREQHAIGRQLADLERARLGLVGHLTEQADPRSEQPLTLDAIAAALPEPRRGRVQRTGDELRRVVADVRNASAVVRSAAEALSRHMVGLTQSVQAAFGRVLVYGRGGRLEPGGDSPFCLDIRS